MGYSDVERSTDEKSDCPDRRRKDESHVADLDRCFSDRGETCGLHVRTKLQQGIATPQTSTRDLHCSHHGWFGGTCYPVRTSLRL